MIKVKVKYLRNIKPVQFYDKGDWIDLRSGEDLILEPGQYYEIPLGIAAELPPGFSAIIAPRSSTFKKWGLLQVDSIGIIDESFCGDSDEWIFPALAMRKTHIHKNDRICQFRVIKQSDYLDVQIVEHLGNPDRGGFGTTGTNEWKGANNG